ncbi:hypothetical protein ACFV3R_25215 [Streptomyces sp. NPDC059740]|uniref:hypothetical protein n=1 Tax=Streptomyces sp. NPDC059740 TaxID=3346926 RepID=UPI003654E026
MIRDLDTDIHQLADEVAQGGHHYAAIAGHLLAIHDTPVTTGDQAAGDILTLAGEESVIALIALVLEGRARTTPVMSRQARDRHPAQCALASLTAELTALAVSGRADDAAVHINP